MYLPVIRKSIIALEEKGFYGVALMYLDRLGYSNLSMTDGSGDGGRDVVSGRSDIVIQLSVRKDWQTKINEEAYNATQRGITHLLYVTNRAILESARQDFFSQDFKYAGQVDVQIHDVNSISTLLARPGIISQVHEYLGLKIPTEIQADEKDVALSSLLLFSTEAKELREDIVDANVKAVVLKYGTISEDTLLSKASDLLPWAVSERLVKSSISRLRGAGQIQGGKQSIRLSTEQLARMSAAESNLNSARIVDINALADEFDLEKSDAENALNIAIEILLRKSDLESAGAREEELRLFISKHNLSRRKKRFFEALSACETAKLKQHGDIIDHICQSNTFDIYRALGRKTDLTVLLDASVAMPVLCGLSFGHVRSRYGTAASALIRACKSHGIKLAVPASYLNEMAYHGRSALEYVPVHSDLPDIAKSQLVGSKNAYLSHYSHIFDLERSNGRDLPFSTFLSLFGIKPYVSQASVENRMESLLSDYGISIVYDGEYDSDIFKMIANEKRTDPKVLVEHDARVCTFVKKNIESGFVFATWDKILIDVMQGLNRVYADNPARVIDFLSITNGVNTGEDVNYQLLTSLIHIDERKSEALARVIERIRTSDAAYQLKLLTDQMRSKWGSDWVLSAEDIYPILESSSEDSRGHDLQ
jgi:hypothetical protein